MQVNIKGKAYDIIDPNVCPFCHVTMVPHHRGHFFDAGDVDLIDFITIWACTNLICRKTFIALYQKIQKVYIFQRYLNGLPNGPNWPKPILDLKSVEKDKEGSKKPSRFIKIYLQSLQAENSGLTEIAGMGYRKALEYLVKDWAIQNNESEKEKIKISWLGKVINDYYEGDLKEILDRATWLGNDQSHYIKLFEEFDTNVLKELINLIMSEFDREYKKRHYLETIKNKKLS